MRTFTWLTRTSQKFYFFFTRVNNILCYGSRSWETTAHEKKIHKNKIRSVRQSSTKWYNEWNNGNYCNMRAQNSRIKHMRVKSHRCWKLKLETGPKKIKHVKPDVPNIYTYVCVLVLAAYAAVQLADTIIVWNHFYSRRDSNQMPIYCSLLRDIYVNMATVCLSTGADQTNHVNSKLVLSMYIWSPKLRSHYTHHTFCKLMSSP